MANVLYCVGDYAFPLQYDISNLGEHRNLADIIEDRRFITDITGVPLDSDRNNPPTELDFEYTPCPYKESPTRYPDGAPSPVPMSGLERRRLTQSFPQIRRQLLATRAGYLSLLGLDRNRTFTVEDGLNVLGTMQYLPTYLTERAKNPVAVEGELPQDLIVAANCASGSTGALGAYSRGNNDLAIAEGSKLLDAAEHMPNAGLVGEKTVCAASPRMITQFLDLLRSGSDTIKHGPIEDETAGLLTADELPSALVLGMNLESLLAYNEIAARADMIHSQSLQKFNPRKHNPRRAVSALRDFKQEVGRFVEGYSTVSRGVNLALGRVDINPDEFADVYTGNPYRFATVSIAQQKGLNVSAA